MHKKKWPNVPAVYGWLTLSRRGEWYIKDTRVNHKRLNNFLNENYKVNSKGEWYVQNGPQNVFVNLEYTPLIARVQSNQFFITQNNLKYTSVKRALMDEDGNLLLQGEKGIMLVDDRDLSQLSNWIIAEKDSLSLSLENCVLAIEQCERKKVPSLFNFVPEPTTS